LTESSFAKPVRIAPASLFALEFAIQEQKNPTNFREKALQFGIEYGILSIIEKARVLLARGMPIPRRRILFMFYF
jgi:hypothetical protein